MVLELEKAREKYRRKDAIGIPMSVRERYEKAFSEIRSRIRERRNGEGGKRLDEILIDLGSVDEDTLWCAVERQVQGRHEDGSSVAQRGAKDGM